jgi:excisionase family DNA binding protein
MTQPAARTTEIAALLGRLVELLNEPPKPPPVSSPSRPLPKRLLLTAEEAAEALGIGRTSVYALIKSGEIESVQIGRLRRIPSDAISDYVRRCISNRTAA